MFNIYIKNAEPSRSLDNTSSNHNKIPQVRMADIKKRSNFC